MSLLWYQHSICINEVGRKAETCEIDCTTRASISGTGPVDASKDITLFNVFME